MTVAANDALKQAPTSPLPVLPAKEPTACARPNGTRGLECVRCTVQPSPSIHPSISIHHSCRLLSRLSCPVLPDRFSSRLCCSRHLPDLTGYLLTTRLERTLGRGWLAGLARTALD